MEFGNDDKGEGIIVKKRNGFIPLLLTVLIFLFIVAIFIMSIYLCLHFKNDTITEKSSDES